MLEVWQGKVFEWLSIRLPMGFGVRLVEITPAIDDLGWLDDDSAAICIAELRQDTAVSNKVRALTAQAPPSLSPPKSISPRSNASSREIPLTSAPSSASAVSQNASKSGVSAMGSSSPVNKSISSSGAMSK